MIIYVLIIYKLQRLINHIHNYTLNSFYLHKSFEKCGAEGQQCMNGLGPRGKFVRSAPGTFIIFIKGYDFFQAMIFPSKEHFL